MSERTERVECVIQYVGKSGAWRDWDFENDDADRAVKKAAQLNANPKYSKYEFRAVKRTIVEEVL